MDIPKINRVTLSLPEEILRSQDGARFIQVEEPGCSYPTSNRSHGSFGTYTEFIVARAKKWMIQSPCAIVTAWRNGDTRAVKDANNRNLLQELRGLGCGVAKVRGCYAEVGCEASQENSFFVFVTDQNPGLPLKNDVYELACKYNQDCFLYKEPGLDSHAYLIGSNADFGIGKEVDLGILRINEMSAENYTKLDGGRISFGQ